MPSEHTTTVASDGGAIPTYISVPDHGTGPGVIMIVSIMGVAEDMIEYADKLAVEGFVAAAPDPFWRDEDPGPVSGEGARERGFARMGRVDHAVNQSDLEAVMNGLKAHPSCNGQVVVMGFCFGGQYAYWGASKYGAAAGIAFHSGKVSELMDDIGDVNVPLSWHWGDDDMAAPPDELEAVEKAFSGSDEHSLFVYPGGKHGFTQWTNPAAWNEEIRDSAWARSLDVLKGI